MENLALERQHKQALLDALRPQIQSARIALADVHDGVERNALQTVIAKQESLESEIQEIDTAIESEEKLLTNAVERESQSSDVPHSP